MCFHGNIGESKSLETKSNQSLPREKLMLVLVGRMQQSRRPIPRLTRAGEAADEKRPLAGNLGGSSVPGAAYARCVCAAELNLICTREVGDQLMGL